METIELSKDHLVFLLKRGLINPEVGTSSLQLSKNNICVVTMSEDEIEHSRDKLIEIFVRDGLHSNQEPNQLGIYIEDIIDVFNIYD